MDTAKLASAILRLDEIAQFANGNADAATDKDNAMTWRSHARRCREVRDQLVEACGDLLPRRNEQKG